MVYAAPCNGYTPESCQTALKAVAGSLDWVQPGMTVGIKANLVHAAAPDTAATTHPALLKALTDMLRRRGARVIIGDSPGGLYNDAHLRKVYRLCGLEDTGAELNWDFSIAQAAYPEGKVLKSFPYTAWLDSCDAVINFCKLKTHGMMAMTGAVKNLFGTIPGTIKPEFHYRYPDPMDFADMLVDLQLYWKPRLHLTDAVVIMEGNGPTAGTPHPMGLVLASGNPFDLDQVCARLMGLEPEQIPTQQAALARGLVEQPDFPEALLPFCQRDLKLPPAKSTLFRSILPGKAGVLAGKAIGQLISPRPTLVPDRCVGCGKCRSLCPAQAIVMREKMPRIRRSRCIRCFCCQEFCPKGALEVKRPPIARILTHSRRHNHDDERK